MATGCNGGGARGATVTAFPDWEFRDYERIAVMPVQTADPRARRDAETMTDRLSELLTSNGAFTVVSRSELKDVMTEQDLSRLADVADPETVLPERKIAIAQALVVAKITDYQLIADRTERRRPRYARDPQGRIVLDRNGRRIIVGEDVSEVYRHGAVVGGSVRVVDAATNKILVSYTTPPIAHEVPQTGQPPRVTPKEIASALVNQLAVDLYKHIAPIQTRVKLKKDALLVATEYFDGRYETTSKLPSTLPDFLLVVRNLPPECDRNTFRAAISERDGRENLFESPEFVWSGNTGPEGVSFTVPMSSVEHSAGNRYVAKLYSGKDPAPMLTRNFEIVAPKNEKRRARDEEGRAERSNAERARPAREDAKKDHAAHDD